MSKKKTKKIAEEIWFDPEDPVGYTGVEKLAKRIKKPKEETTKWLRNQLAYSLNKPMRRKFPTRKYKSGGINHLWQGDLMEMIPYAKINDGYKYILNLIDVFTRFARAIPLKNKSGKEVSEALMKIFKNDIYPYQLQTDLGKEFYNKECKVVFKKYDINHYSVHSQFKAALVERFNRTLRDRLKKYFTKSGKKRWVDVLPKIIMSYNHSPHRGINNLRPVDITDDNEMEIWDNRNTNLKPTTKPKYKVGDYVRISKISLTPFIKNFDQNWSDEVYKISKINTRQSPIMYTLIDSDNEIIEGKFYEQELQVLPRKPTEYRIQEILEEKGKGKNKQLLVKWHGYKKPSWIKASKLII